MVGVVIGTWEQDESGNEPLYPLGCSCKGKRKQPVEVELYWKFLSSVTGWFHHAYQHFTMNLGTSFSPQISARPKPLIIFIAGLPNKSNHFMASCKLSF